jgi:RNA polymerase sigma-70 factor (ECF subfamily)
MPSAAGCKRNGGAGDPVAILHRIRYMFSNVDWIEDFDARPLPPPGALAGNAPACPATDRGSVDRVTRMSDGPTHAAADWVDHVLRIREARDEAAFAELFAHFAPRVKAFLIRSGADNGLAEECAQEVMATLWQKAHLFDPARASVSTWVFTIARNRRIDALRRQRRPEPEDLPWGPEAEPQQEDVLALQQDSERLAAALRSLPEKQRLLIERAYFGELSHSEIAEETGLPLGTIKSRIRLALDRLRHALK